APGQELAEHQLALRLTAAGQHDEALHFHERVRESAGRIASYALPYSDALLRAGRPDDALVIAREVVADHPNMAHAQAWLGRLLLARGDLREAIVHAEAARRSASHWLYRRTLWQYRWMLARHRVSLAIGRMTRGRGRADALNRST
ncbi:MAG: tetratricopeptide repeat protein, partial [Sphingomonas sp.]